MVVSDEEAFCDFTKDPIRLERLESSRIGYREYAACLYVYLIEEAAAAVDSARWSRRNGCRSTTALRVIWEHGDVHCERC